MNQPTLSATLSAIDDALSKGHAWEAMARVREGMVRYPASGLLRVRLAMAHLALGEQSAAQAALEAAYALSPGLAGADAPEPVSAPPTAPLTGPVPVVSIVIPLFNKADYTQRCLASIVAQAPDVSFELVLVDNGSTDETARLLASLEGDVRVIVNRKNFGFAHACNQGAAVARGRYIFFLNNDTEAHPGWLDALVARLEAEPETVAVGSRLLFPDGSLQHAGVEVIVRQSDGWLDFRHRYYRFPGDFVEAATAARVQVLTGAALMVRREAFEAAGGFDEGYGNGYEDVDLCLTLQAAGGRLVYEPASCLTHFEAILEPERWRKVEHDVARMQARWGGRVAPDWRLDATGLLAANVAAPNGPREPGMTSVVLLAYNQLAYNEACVASVLEHSDRPFELILVDNGSTDGTAEFFAAVAESHPRVRCVLNARNLGFGQGNNQGLALAKGEFVVVLNNDTIVPRNWLSRLLTHFEGHPERGAVGPLSNKVSGMQRLPGVPVENSLAAVDQILDFGDHLHASGHGQGFNFDRLVGFCLVVRGEILDRIGGFDPAYGIGNFEDDDMCLRLRSLGYETWVAQDVYVHHFGSRTFAQLGADVYNRSLHRNWALFKAKWGIDPALPQGAPYQATLYGFDPVRHFVPLPDPADPRWFAQRVLPVSLDGRRAVAVLLAPDWRTDDWREGVTGYVRAFGPQDDVTLVLWIDPAQGVPAEEVCARIEAIFEAEGLSDEQAPDLLIVAESLSGLDRLFASVDAFIPAASQQIEGLRAALFGLTVLPLSEAAHWRQALGLSEPLSCAR
jgi:GT2 family glycosyltransferase